MASVATHLTGHKSQFDMVAAPFVQGQGLPFTDVLDAQSIQRVFKEEDALFGQEDIFSTQIVLWAFLAQTLRDGKGAACSAAVADIATYMLQTGQCPPCGDTGDYCRARAKLSLTALRRLVAQSAEQLEGDADQSWLWKGLHAKLVDGFTFTMPDTPENQEAFPQLRSQSPGVGFPIARVCTVISLATACVCNVAIGPYQGKQTGENALLWDMLGTFGEGEVVVFDRYCCKTPEMVGRQLWVTLLAYNLIRRVMATSAAIHHKQPRALGFTLACQTVLASWMLFSTGSCSNTGGMYTTMLGQIAANEVANRPGRIEPRVLKRRRHRYPLMQHPRDQLRAELGKT